VVAECGCAFFMAGVSWSLRRDRDAEVKFRCFYQTLGKNCEPRLDEENEVACLKAGKPRSRSDTGDPRIRCRPAGAGGEIFPGDADPVAAVKAFPDGALPPRRHATKINFEKNLPRRHLKLRSPKPNSDNANVCTRHGLAFSFQRFIFGSVHAVRCLDGSLSTRPPIGRLPHPTT